jgi:hypothetical protein
MSQHFHALVWIDHPVAKIWYFNADEADMVTIHSAHPHQHLHHKANSGDSGHAAVDVGFLERITAALMNSGAILITGPANAKKELMTHIQDVHRSLAPRISGVETLDHPSEGQLLALGRKFFKADDRMQSQAHRS